MLAPYFFHNTLENLSVSFGSLFNNIYILRTKANGEEEERIKVPISYGPKEAYLLKNKQDEDLHKEVAIELPRMSYQRIGLSYASARKINRLHVTTKDIEFEKRLKQFSPAPYDINYELYIVTKNQIDADQIVEQILPFFTPAFDISIRPIPEMNFIEDIPVILNSVTPQDDYTGDFINRRTLSWTLSFTMKANFYGPIREQGVIKKSIIDIGIPVGGDEIDAEVIARTPRTQRFTATPDPLDTLPDSDGNFNYNVEFEEFFDGKKRNPATGQDEDIE